ncbi:LamG-like jellyroll fold domain-containing protein [Crossiella cryophila]|uniref:Sugar lactone lactonase YvrE n=1 Tax=Crossiella cryophila TaxID=43355 RepID=A0A7W7CCU2_9PSEU|nr:LamG-like jellyroll fold domain-containing protein [Crossiella cryophila]MBB4678761.1 sugar lactone lactonase YvrE [Crossiella cryophila]
MRRTKAGTLVAGALSQVVLLTAASMAFAVPSAAAAGDLGTVDMGGNTQLSAAVYDSRGQLVRHLEELAPRTGKVTLRWDGKDDSGQDLPKGTYTWRAATSATVGKDDGGVGDSGQPQPGYAYEASDAPGKPAAVAYGPDGDLYVQSAYEEMHGNIRRYRQGDIATGKRVWASRDGFANQGVAVAADDRYVYAAIHADYDQGYQSYRIVRLDGATGKPANWYNGGGITVGKWQQGTMPVTGIATDENYLWVVDAGNNELRTFFKGEGGPAPVLEGRSFLPLDNPRGIVAAGPNRFWIVTGDHVSRYRHDVGTQRLIEETRTPALNQPYGVALHGSTLFVSEVGTGQVRRYDVAGAKPVQTAAWFGTMTPGTVSDTEFGWKYDGVLTDVPTGNAAIAVSPDGKTLAVVDVWNGRTMFYDAGTGTPKPERLQGLPDPTPDIQQTPDGPRLVSQAREYDVDYQRAGHPWRLASNWVPTDLPEYSRWVSLRWVGGRQYAYVFTGRSTGMPLGGVLIYRLHTERPGHGMRQVGRIKVANTPPRNEYDTPNPALEISTDANGDGKYDPAETEVTNHAGYTPGAPSVSVDAEGTLWFASAGVIAKQPRSYGRSGVAKLPLRAVDNGNPVYKVDDFALVAEYRGDPSGAHEATGAEVRYDSTNKRVFAAVRTGEFDAMANHGGNAVLMLDLRTGQRSLVSGRHLALGPPNRARDSVDALAVDSTDGYYYVGNATGGSAQGVTRYTWDGLATAHARSDTTVYSSGLFDQGMSLAAFTHTNGTRYVYAQDDGYGRNSLYAFTGAGSERRSEGSTEWPGSPVSNGLLAWLKLDSGLLGATNPGGFAEDSSGKDNWGVFLGNGKPMSRLPWERDGGVHRGALTFDGDEVRGVHFGKNSWSGAPDRLIDSRSALTVATWVRTTDSGPILSYQNTAFTNNDTTPARSATVLAVGADGYLQGGIGCAQAKSAQKVNDGQWHHVALSVGPTVQTLYVDGAAVPIQCQLPVRDQGFTALGVAYTPGTGYTRFKGSLDDVRVYDRTLPAAEITQVGKKEDRGPFASWPLMSFDGKATRVTLPNEIAENAPLTFTLRMKPAPGGGVILGDQRTPYPVELPKEYEVTDDKSLLSKKLLSLDPDGTIRGNLFDNAMKSEPQDIYKGQWHRLTVTVTPEPNDRFRTVLYLGEKKLAEASSLSAHWGFLRSATQLGVGQDGSGVWQFYQGQLDDVRCYDRVLSLEEIRELP